MYRIRSLEVINSESYFFNRVIILLE
jgi:hypothetical protein